MPMEATKEHVFLGTKGEKVLLRDGFDGNHSMKIWDSQLKKKKEYIYYISIPVLPVTFPPGKG